MSARGRSASRVLLGALLILHGLANSVLPLRGIDASGPGIWLPAVAVLYIITIIGFTAGLGVLGVRPVNRIVLPAVWMAALAAPAAQPRVPYSDLWVGIVLSAALPILTTLFVVTTPVRNWGAFVLLPQVDGRTRLVIRSTISDERIPVWAAGMNLMLFELPHFVMQRRMLLGIRSLAERTT